MNHLIDVHTAKASAIILVADRNVAFAVIK